MLMTRHFLYWRFFDGRLGLALLGLLIVVGIVLLIVFLTSRKHPRGSVKAASGAQSAAGTASTPANAVSGDPHGKILDLLRVASEEKQVSAADYEERRMVLDGGKYDNYRRAELVELKEKYARFELSTQEYIEARAKLLNL
jgi:protein-S-isoprenylcysteine O-methyltransferase Ste14